ncbi:hypothetical protein NW801_15115 [Brevibacillus laterosporus]|uniref:Uncharacterized protein n=1 Tax=Brevibacillus halotolerans TaxID=1507437 RepID=A0ABT4HZ51_9BACL|nr:MULTISPECIES: hypothetical protein [Brevibacillus]MCR8986357.1 hypothetical protein [Brevibacillus laterosporus]MCZ0832092.1 hypothetical protein [Brevibacillus halotolerans]
MGTTSISHVDLTPGTGNVTYSITAHIVGGGSATVIGGDHLYWSFIIVISAFKQPLNPKRLFAFLFTYFKGAA